METHRVAPATARAAAPAAAAASSALEGRVERAIARFRAGRDRERSFALLFESYHRRVERFFAAKGFSPEECLDLTQETFLGIYRGLEGFRGEASFNTWLYSVAANVYLKRLRSAAAAKRTGHEVPVDDAAGAEVPRAGASQLSAVLLGEKRRALAEAVDELPAQMRRCLELRVYQELRYREIAQVMQVSIDTVKAHLFQARKKLKARLGEVFREGWDF